MATNIPRARNVIATTAVVVSSCFYISYKNHDQRVLTDDDVSNALCALSTVTPTTSSIQQQQSLAAQHIHNLTKYGVTIVEDTLSSSQLETWNTRTNNEFDNGDNIEWNSGRAYYSVSKRLGSISKKSVYYSDMARIGCNNRCDATDDGGGNHIHDTINNDNHDTASSWLGGLWRRRRRRKRSSKGSTEVDTNTTTTEPTNISLQDVVQTYFKQNGIANYELTDVQFLNAYPHSTNQIWHRDNKFRGLTAIVALKDVRQNGPTELIVGSHEAKFSLWNVIKQRDTLSDKPLLGCIDAGDTILYDARIFHRGRGNNVVEDRPVLVLRWDCTRTPPPGMGMIVTMCNTYVGCWLYAALFALQQISPSNDK